MDMTAIEKIESQQKKLKEGSAPYVVGEQIKDMLRREPELEKIISDDLENEDMSLVQAEKKIKSWADQHKTGNFSFVSPGKAEEILREFYGLPEAGKRAHSPERGEPKRKEIRLEDFL